MMEKNKCQIVQVMNLYHIQVFKICASCENKRINDRGKRICMKTQKVVEQQDVCSEWEMSKGCQKAGIGGGVVRLKGTKDIIIR